MDLGEHPVCLLSLRKFLPYEDEDEIVQWIAILQSRATIIQTFITQGTELLDIAVAQEVMSPQPDDVQQHVDTNGNVTKKHKTM